MALMTTSGSMPFSLARASIVCCRGFDIFIGSSFPTPCRPLRCGGRSEFHFQIPARNHAEWYPMRSMVLGVDHHVGALDAAQRASEKPLAVHLLAHHDLRAASGEP